jgi:hypothetical protein
VLCSRWEDSGAGTLPKCARCPHKKHVPSGHPRSPRGRGGYRDPWSPRSSRRAARAGKRQSAWLLYRRCARMASVLRGRAWIPRVRSEQPCNSTAHDAQPRGSCAGGPLPRARRCCSLAPSMPTPRVTAERTVAAAPVPDARGWKPGAPRAHARVCAWMRWRLAHGPHLGPADDADKAARSSVQHGSWVVARRNVSGGVGGVRCSETETPHEHATPPSQHCTGEREVTRAERAQAPRPEARGTGACSCIICHGAAT